MIQITEDNIHKILDISSDQISSQLQNLLETTAPQYKDNEEWMEEHLYSWDEVLLMSENIPEEVGHELIALAEVCNDNEIAYIRIIDK